MWIEGYGCLINTESLRAVQARLTDATSEKWELCVAFHGLDFKSDLIISVHDTEEEAKAAQARFLTILTGSAESVADVVKEMFCRENSP